MFYSLCGSNCIACWFFGVSESIMYRRIHNSLPSLEEVTYVLQLIVSWNKRGHGRTSRQLSHQQLNRYCQVRESIWSLAQHADIVDVVHLWKSHLLLGYRCSASISFTVTVWRCNLFAFYAKSAAAIFLSEHSDTGFFLFLFR